MASCSYYYEQRCYCCWVPCYGWLKSLQNRKHSSTSLVIYLTPFAVISQSLVTLPHLLQALSSLFIQEHSWCVPKTQTMSSKRILCFCYRALNFCFFFLWFSDFMSLCLYHPSILACYKTFFFGERPLHISHWLYFCILRDSETC